MNAHLLTEHVILVFQFRWKYSCHLKGVDVEGSLGRGGKLGKERLMNKDRSFSAVDEPHSQAYL